VLRSLCIEIAKQMKMSDSILYSRVWNLVTAESTEDRPAIYQRHTKFVSFITAINKYDIF
jgi:hypothetical protein